jgi:ATP synthase I chain
MTGRDLATSVTLPTAMAAVVASLAAGWVGGMPGALGVLTGGGLGLAGFRLLTRRVRAAAAGPALAAPWAILAALRFAVVVGAAALLFVHGWAHPVAWLVGYSLLPVVLVVQGLRGAREESNPWT